MKKTLSVVLTSAMALSMFSSVAFGKTSADFTDLKDLDAATKVKFDAMITAGIFDGVTDTTFGLKDEMNRAQFAKVAALIMGLEVNKDLKTSTFTDVSVTDAANGYALPYIEALKTAGVTDGYADNMYNPAGKVTKEQLATFLVRVLGQDAAAKGKTGTDTTVSGWAQGYVALALELKLLSNGTDGKFGGMTNATRDLLVSGAYEAKQQYVPAGKVSVTEAKATGVQQVTVSFNKPVDTAKATVSLKKGTVDVATTVKWSDDKKTATLALTSVKLSEGTYTATLAGVDAATIEKASAEFTAQDEAVSKIEFMNAGDTIAKSTAAKVKLKATNQYGENASFSAGSYTVYAGNNNDVTPVLSKNDNGELVLTLNTAVQAGTPATDVYQSNISVLPINIFQNDNHVTVSKNFKVGTAAFISKMELGAVKYSDGKTALTGTGETATFEVVNYDQYGNVLAFDANPTTGDIANTRVVFNAYEPNLTSAVGDSDNNGVTEVKISLLNNVDKAGDYSFTVYNQAGTATSKVSVQSGKVATKVELGELTSVIAAGDTDAYIPVVAYDANGNKLSVDDLVNAQNVARLNISSSTGAGNAVLVTAGENKGKIQITNIPNTPRSVVSLNVFITSVNATSTANKTYTVAAAPIPERITVATEPAKKIVAGTNAESAFKFVVYDQHGREYKVAKNIDAAGNVTALTSAGITQYRVKVTAEATGTGITAYNNVAGSAFAIGNTPITGSDIGTVFNKEHKFVAPTASAGASATIKAVIEKSVDGGTVWNAVNAPVTRTIESVSNTTELTYSVAPVADLFNAKDSASVISSLYNTGLTLADTDQENPLTSKFAREVTLTAKDAAGNVVELPSTIQSITTSNPTVAQVEVSGGQAYVIGNKVGTATLNVAYVTSQGKQEMKTVTVNVKGDLLQSTKVEVGNTTATIADAKALGSNAFTLMNVKVTDDYGVKYENTDAMKYNYLFGATFSVANVVSSGGKVVVDRYGNLTVDADVTSFELTATSANGFSASTFVN
ncbi:hypothetical protein QFZ77_000826 [Paenibacillus sp. V4I3]|uniref:S-layer homology domain-containing protein n=1 Tax=Paenibacillus sp. V4I3 TaxID=3042305 RepID=UPI00277E3575|nr:S-layer homology domain-containing protein [Paenibacillus sp. V4I3]MDQ0872166.1 hypothetical protein [Paenibacillus sp. V4I3]MDQ0872167.1 hypothetical protein [Paenibacillus sp. V4I3]